MRVDTGYDCRMALFRHHPQGQQNPNGPGSAYTREYLAPSLAYPPRYLFVVASPPRGPLVCSKGRSARVAGGGGYARARLPHQSVTLLFAASRRCEGSSRNTRSAALNFV